MITVFCQLCAIALTADGDDVAQLVGVRSDYYPDGYRCPYCQRRCYATADTYDMEGMSVRELSGVELFAALEGLGLPEDQHCTGEVVETLLKEQPIRRVVGQDVPHTERFCIHHLELWDGTRLYFGSAPEGAIIYRVVLPTSYTDKALNG